ncbi:UNVERIFIED_ORG: hypothetical protein E4P37_16430 [Bacillus sp. AZ43]
MWHWHRRGADCRMMLVYNPGGHRRELEMAVRDLAPSVVLCVTFRPLQGIRFQTEPASLRTVGVTHPRRRAGRLLLNALQSVFHIVAFRPCVIITSGADAAVASVVLGKILFRRRTLFIESAGTLGPTLAGRLCHRFADLMVVQWPEQSAVYPGSRRLDAPLL